MTTDGLLGERPLASAPPLPVSQILDLCDRIVGEIGRRAHMFGWLRAPDAEQWLTVDAYYPHSRLVVVCSDEPGDADDLYAERVPAHGMRLLSIAPSELGSEPDRARAVLEHRIAALGPVPPRPSEVRIDPNVGIVSRAVASLAAPAPGPPSASVGPARATRPERPPHRVGRTQAEAVGRAARFVASSKPWELTPAVAQREAAGARVASARASALLARLPEARDERVGAERSAGQQALGIALGVVLLAVLVAEVYFGVGRFAVGGGHVLLALALALDACARVLGTVAASRADDEGAAWWCALGGSPFVVGFALLAPAGPVRVEPAPLAGFVALAAGVFAALWLVGAALGM
jgi:hypothetical protein